VVAVLVGPQAEELATVVAAPEDFRAAAVAAEVAEDSRVVAAVVAVVAGSS
jgi:hypothetical protein